MLKLYYGKAACSLAPHIALEELALHHELISVDLRKSPSEDFLKINPMGAVPVLLMDNGQPLTEVAVILQYLADLKPDAQLAPKAGTLERYRLQEWLNFIATELHKGFSPLWAIEGLTRNEDNQTDIRQFVTADLHFKFDVVSKKMGSQPYLMLSGFSIADAYLFTVLNWTQFLKIDLSQRPSLKDYLERVRSRPGTIRALKAEHLIHSSES